MRVLVQWARSVASDWEEIDSSDWAALPNRGRPGNQRKLNANRGWVNAINVQGIIFSGDCLAVEDMPHGGVRVWQINDDPRDWASGNMRHMRVVDIPPLGPDPNLNGAINTLSSMSMFGDSGFRNLAGQHVPGRSTLSAWEVGEDAMPDRALMRYGVWVEDQLYADHQLARKTHGWREWTDHLPSVELKPDGTLLPQRPRGRYIHPKGTKTFYHNVQALPIPAVPGDNENQLGTVPIGVAVQNSGNQGTNASLKWATATTASEPNNAAWPTGNYRHQIDCIATTPDLIFGCLTLDSADGGFYRYDAALNNLLERFQQQEAAFALTGLFLATTGSVSWTAGATSDRFGFGIVADKIAGHGNDTMDLQLGEADDFTDGPWPTTASQMTNAPYFGSNA